MNIVVLSAFRNAAHFVDRYFRQVRALRNHAGSKANIRVVAVHGDSADNTEQKLSRYLDPTGSYGDQLITYNHGKRTFISDESPERLQTLTQVMRTMLSAVDLMIDDVVLYVESDLIWQPHEVGSIIDLAHNRQDDFDIIAPLVFAGPNFYDVWGFRKDGTRFAPYYPYHSGLDHDKLINQVDSVGSCLAFRAEIAARVNPFGELGLWSWCIGATQQGYKVGVSTWFRVEHPA